MSVCKCGEANIQHLGKSKRGLFTTHDVSRGCAGQASGEVNRLANYTFQCKVFLWAT